MVIRFVQTLNLLNLTDETIGLEWAITNLVHALNIEFI